MLQELLKIRSQLDALIEKYEKSMTTKKHVCSDDDKLIHGLIVAVTYKMLSPEKYRNVVFGDDFLIEN